MAKVSAPKIPVELNDGTKFEIGLDEARELTAALLETISPLPLKPLSFADVNTTLQMPPDVEDVPG